MLEYALVTRARCFLLPPDHPTRIVFEAARGAALATWESSSRALLGDDIADIIGHPLFTSLEVQHAMHDSDVRRSLLKRYRWNVVRPALLEREMVEFSAASAKIIPVLGVSYSSLVTSPRPFPHDWFCRHQDATTWFHYRVWALMRLTGAWPSALYGEEAFPLTIDSCKLCGEPDISILHPLVICRANASLFLHASGLLPMPPREHGCTFIRFLFTDKPCMEHMATLCALVSKAVSRCLLPAEVSDWDQLPLERACDDWSRLANGGSEILDDTDWQHWDGT